MGANGTFSQSGNIVLSHEINNMTMDFFIKHYPDIKKSYKHVLDVATCMNITNPYAETSVTFPTFEQAVGGASSGAASGQASTAPAATANASKASATSAGNTAYIFNGPLFIAALFGLLTNTEAVLKRLWEKPKGTTSLSIL
ncbi:hypothetical protein CU098_004318 [Rhizopus stolonifer]|uniref:Uncharacterized protein n=1 Tax=Rhizopus stolonifer TaxID=4846 RepID=A0A367KLW6_RHIST|nr:hypothetical protein CU098_004318 [Rhizopus stolonifer]